MKGALNVHIPVAGRHEGDSGSGWYVHDSATGYSWHAFGPGGVERGFHPDSSTAENLAKAAYERLRSTGEAA